MLRLRALMKHSWNMPSSKPEKFGNALLVNGEAVHFDSASLEPSRPINPVEEYIVALLTFILQHELAPVPDRVIFEQEQCFSFDARRVTGASF